MKLQRDLLSREFFSMFFVVIYLAVSIYFGIIFYLHAVEKDNLFFSLATLLSAVYFFFRTQIKYLVFEDFLLMKKMEYIVLFLIFSVFLEFVTHYTARPRSRLHYVFHMVTLTGIIAIVASNNPVVWHAVLKNMIQPSWIFPVAYSFYLIANDLRAGKKVGFLLAAFIVLTVTLVNDVLVNRGIYNFVSLSGYAYLFLIIGIAYIMHRRFIELKKKAESIEEVARDGGGEKKPRIGAETEEKLKKALRIIEMQFAEDITREYLADEVGMNADYFGKLFKQYTGKKTGEYVNEVRIRKAQELLSDPENNIASIAFAVGFESLPTFYRVFQKYAGDSPQSFRKKISDWSGKCSS
jgi:AraC-like DNA-binding protein